MVKRLYSSSTALRAGFTSLAAVCLMISATDHASAADPTFHLFVNKSFRACLEQPGTRAKAIAQVRRGRLNDTLELDLSGFKPGLNFDLFTVEKSNQLADGTPDPGFTNFGLAWYQSDVHITADGTGAVKIKTILLDQIFGFDPVVSLPPTNTFHVGFWFNNPADAQAAGCPNTVTPFNGEHNAGIQALSTRNFADAQGPLRKIQP